MLVAHVSALSLSGHDAVVTPISQLSRGAGVLWHTLGLLAFAGAHLALGAVLGRIDAGGWMWRWGVRGLFLNAGLLVLIALYFAFASDAHLFGPDANDPLSVLASVTGFVMGLLGPGWLRLHRSVGVFNALCLLVWLALVPLILWVDASWLGAYERIVGSVFLLWVAGLAWGALRVPDDAQTPPAT